MNRRLALKAIGQKAAVFAGAIAALATSATPARAYYFFYRFSFHVRRHRRRHRRHGRRRR